MTHLIKHHRALFLHQFRPACHEVLEPMVWSWWRRQLARQLLGFDSHPLQLRDLQLRDLQCENQCIAREQTYSKGRESGSPSQEDREATRVTRAATRGRDRTGMESWTRSSLKTPEPQTLQSAVCTKPVRDLFVI